MADQLNDNDMLLVFQHNPENNRFKALRAPWSLFKSYFMQGAKGDKGDIGPQGPRGIPGPQGQPRRIERYSGTTNASGVITITFSTPFTVVPDIDVIEAWSGEQMISGAILTSSTTGCTAKIMVSRGALLLSAGPFQTAPVGITATVRAIGY